MRANARTRRVGIALQADRLVARLPAEQSDPNSPEVPKLWIRPLTPTPDGDSWTDLAEAFKELHHETGINHGVMYVALMPPLSQLRRLDLAGATESEATRIVSRDPARFLPLRSKRLAVELQGTGWRRRAPFLLVAAPAAALEAIGSAAQQTSWSLGSVVPAQLAWATIGRGRGRTRREAREVIVCLGTHIEIVRAEPNGMITVRRIPLPHDDATPSAVRALCTERGVIVSSEARIIVSTDEAAALAAELAPLMTGPTLLPIEERTLVMQRVRRATMLRLAVATLLLAVAGGLELFGLAHERASIAAERARMRRTVGQAVVVRESVAVLSERLAAVRAIAMDSPRWSAWLATLADELPSDAFLASLNAEGDSLHLEGNATRAAPVFDALTSVRGIQGVRPEGPIRQEVRNGGATSEHFVLAARLARPDSLQGTTTGRATPNAKAIAAKGRAP
jgi:hypothetical protein